MIIDFDRLDRGRLSVRHTVEPGDTALEGYDRKIVGPLDVRADVTSSTGSTYVIRVVVEGTALDRCRRCLEVVEMPIDLRFDLVAQVADEAGRDSGDDDVILISRKDTEIEISEEIRQRLVLDRAVFPVCSEECRGICSLCGADLNERECGCTEDEVDDRWSALSSVRFDD